MRRTPTLEQLRQKYVRIDKAGCHLWTGFCHKKGYGRLTHNKIKYSAHRFFWKQINGEIPIGKSVLHTCDVRNCVNPKHLWIGTQDDNMKDAAKKKRLRRPSQPGESNACSKLTEKQVLEMKRLRLQGGLTYKAIGDKFKVTDVTASDVIRGKSWRHLNGK